MIKMLNNELYKQKTYMAPLVYLLDATITEYDLKKANISVLLSKGAITQDQYNYYYNLPKQSREIQIGLLQRSNPEYTKILQEGIIEAKRLFFDANDVSSGDVLTIKNDAIFLINRTPKVTKFGTLEFAKKNQYTSFYKINNLEFYYYYDFITKQELLDIKGLGDYAYELHRNYFIDFLKVLFCSAQLDPMEEVISLLQDFHNNYINNRLPIGYYRELNSASMFKIIQIPGSIHTYASEHFNSLDLNCLDKSHNENMLRQLYMIYNNILLGRL